MQPDGEVRIEVTDGVLRVHIHRPQKKNALTTGMYGALADAFARADTEEEIRVLLLHGEPEAFTAGNDLQDFLTRPATGPASPVARFLHALSHARKPVVAAVGGVAVGIGVTLLLHCDLVYAAEGTRFQLPFVDLGLCPELGSTLLLPALIGHQRAAELLLLAGPFDAARAHALGLVNEVVAPERLLETATAAARRLAAKPPAAVQVTKALLRRAPLPAIEAAIAEELRQFGERLRSPEARAALEAFLARRRA
jgi:enoyl-CoA hydratase/carnithine racemase